MEAAIRSLSETLTGFLGVDAAGAVTGDDDGEPAAPAMEANIHVQTTKAKGRAAVRSSPRARRNRCAGATAAPPA